MAQHGGAETALTRMPQWRPFEAITGTFAAARALAIASLITVPVVAAITWLVSAALLEPSGLAYLRTLAFVAVILGVVPLVEWGFRRDGRLRPQDQFVVLSTRAAGCTTSAESDGANDIELDKSNILLIGPTGSGSRMQIGGHGGAPWRFAGRGSRTRKE